MTAVLFEFDSDFKRMFPELYSERPVLARNEGRP